MKGAITEPLVITTSPPNTTIMIRTGSSQYFLRTRMNRQSSATKSILCPSKLVSHGLGRWPGRLPHDPVAVRVRLPLQPQRVLSEHPHDEAGRQNRAVEQQRHHDRADHAVEKQSEPQPYQVQWMENRGTE